MTDLIVQANSYNGEYVLPDPVHLALHPFLGLAPSFLGGRLPLPPLLPHFPNFFQPL